jgi:hypothetical protein
MDAALRSGWEDIEKAGKIFQEKPTTSITATATTTAAIAAK